MQDIKKSLSETTVWLNRLSLLLGVIIAIGYAYIFIPTALGLLFGITTALANLYIMWIISDNALNEKVRTTNSLLLKTIYLIVAGCAVLLSAASVFTHTYTSMMLLAPLLPTVPLLLMALFSYTLAACFTTSVFFSLLFRCIVVGVNYKVLKQKTFALILYFKRSPSIFPISPIY